MREAKRSLELWEDGKRYAFPAFPQLLLLNKVESINPDTKGKHQPGRSGRPRCQWPRISGSHNGLFPIPELPNNKTVISYTSSQRCRWVSSRAVDLGKDVVVRCWSQSRRHRSRGSRIFGNALSR